MHDEGILCSEDFVCCCYEYFLKCQNWKLSSSPLNTLSLYASLSVASPNTLEKALYFAFPPITAVQRHAPHQEPHQNLETQRQTYIGQHI